MTNTNVDIGKKKRTKIKLILNMVLYQIQDAQIACNVLGVKRKNPYSLDFSTVGEEIQHELNSTTSFIVINKVDEGRKDTQPRETTCTEQLSKSTSEYEGNAIYSTNNNL